MKIYLLIAGLVLSTSCWAQPAPAVDENIPFLVTFGVKSPMGWGDDDHCQIYFFKVPETQKTPFFIRIFDPDVGGKHDENRSGFDTKTAFTLYGAGCYSDKDTENKDPVGNYKRGNLLFTKTFGAEPTYDNGWYSFGPINPTEGELKPELGGYIFKLIAQGTAGDDGNLYRYYLSTKKDQNIPVEDGNAFTFEYSFRLHPDPNTVSHIYPYVDINTIQVKQHNFDFDNDAHIRIISMSNPGFRVPISADGTWTESMHPIKEKDINTCLDVRIIKKGAQGNNNVVFFMTNQYGEFLPFHAVPIGTIPKKKIGVIKRQ